MKPINVQLFDKILNGMPIDGRMSSLIYDSEEEERDWTEALYVLKAYGYVYLEDSEYSGIQGQGLTDDGIIFVSKGGFSEEKRLQELMDSDNELQRDNWITTTRTSKQAFWVSVFSLLAAFIAIAVSISSLQ